MQPHSPVLRSGDLVILEIQELVGRHIVGKDIAPLCLKHGREDDAMEHDIVLSYKVHHSGLRVFPVLLPVRGQLPGCGDIPDGGVEPDVQHFTLSVPEGYGHSPVKVTTDSPGLKPLVKP